MKSDSKSQDPITARPNASPSVTRGGSGAGGRRGVVEPCDDVRARVNRMKVERFVQARGGVEASAVEPWPASPAIDGHDDAEITRHVEAGLTSKNGLGPNALTVIVERGTVTLTGEVDSGYEKQAALDSLRHVRGVNAVVDDIDIKRTVSERAVRDDIKTALYRRADAEAAKISVSVDQNDVTLTGKVHSRHEGRAAIESAEASRGVRHVVDRLAVEE